jgi:HEPN domain-containing protein
MPARSEDWLRQAQRDVEHARRSLEGGDYEWACFAAQQSAEKAVKALFLKANRTAWGHSVAALLQVLPDPWQAGEALVDAGKELDKHYIPPRYPNSHPQGAPYDYYTRGEAERAIAHTTKILAFCERLLAEPGAGADVPPAGGEESG